MPPVWNGFVWSQFGAAIESLERAIHACPESLWGDRTRMPEYWYLVYHTLFWLDCYLSPSREGFAPPAPFTLGEFDAGVMPERVYTQAELLRYLAHGRNKCRQTLAALTDAHAASPCGFEHLRLTVGELHLYNLRHVQHHTAQLNLLLRQTVNDAPRWVARTDLPL